MALTAALTILVGGIGIAFGALPAVAEYGLIAPLASVLTSVVLLARGRQNAAIASYVAAIWSIVALFVYLSGGARSPVAMSFVSTTVMAGALAGPRLSLVVAAASGAALGVFALLGEAGIPAIQYVKFTPLLAWLVQAASLTFAGYLMFDTLRALNLGLLRASEGEGALRDLVQTAPEGIVALDKTGRVVQLNPAACTALGVEPGARTSIYDLPWADPASVRSLLDAGSVDPAGGIVAELRDSLGEMRELELIGHPLPVSSVNAAVRRLSIRDVTARRRAERERDGLNERVRKAERLEALGLLAGGVAHDFNNLITVVLVNAKLLLDSESMVVADVRTGLEEIVLTAERTAEITRQLLAFGRKQVLQPEVLRISDVIRSALPLVRRLLREDIQLTTELDDTVYIEADQPSLIQVLINLVSNARDAMSSGGDLRIRCYRAAPSAKDLPDGDLVALEVSDSGAGLSPETRARMFEPFFTTKEAGLGTGLGLSVVQSIVAQSAGHIEIVSEPGRGTTIQVLFPSRLPLSGDASKPIAARPQTKRASILLVEDDASVRAVARRILVAAGHEVTEAQDGEEALGIATTRRFDVLLSDIVMPKLSGVQLARTLKKRQPELAIVLMSGYAANAFGTDAEISDSHHFVSKPFTPSQLVAAIDAALQAHAHESQRLQRLPDPARRA